MNQRIELPKTKNPANKHTDPRIVDAIYVQENSIIFALGAILLTISFANFVEHRRSLLLVTLIICFMLFVMSDTLTKRHCSRKNLLFPFSLIFISYLLSYLENPDTSTQLFERAMQALVALAVLLVGLSFEWNRSRSLWLQRSLTLTLIAFTATWILSAFSTNYFSSFYYHGNAFGVVVFVCFTLFTFTGILLSRANLIQKGVCILLIIASGSRSSLLALTIFLVCGLAFRNRNGGSKGLFISLSVLVTACISIFTLAYPIIFGTPLGLRLEEASRELLGKNFFSGREIVWLNIIDAARDNPLTGLGIDTNPSHIYETIFSAHNLYLQTLIQSGLIGVLAIFAVIITLTTHMARLQKPFAGYGLGLVLGIAIHQTFEVSLTQNNIDIGLLMWAAIGVYGSQALSKSDRIAYEAR